MVEMLFGRLGSGDGPSWHIANGPGPQELEPAKLQLDTSAGVVIMQVDWVDGVQTIAEN
jgi:hypothetical protein